MKKIISLLLALTLVFTMSSVVSMAASGDALLDLQTFDHQEVGYVWPDRAPFDSEGWRSQTGKYNNQYPTAVEIVSENGNNVAKITHTDKYLVEFVNDYITKVTAPVITASYKVKFADKASPRNLILRGSKEQIVLTFKADGTVLIGSSAYLETESGSKFVYDTNVWYDVEVVYDTANSMIGLTVKNGEDSFYGWGTVASGNSQIYRIDFYNTTASASESVMYVDDVKVVEGGSIKTVDIDFNEFTALDDTASAFGNISMINGVTPVYGYADRGEGDMAFKIDLPGNIGYWQGVKHHTGKVYSSGIVLAETDIYFPDDKLNRALCIRTSKGQTSVVRFGVEGGIQIGDNNMFAPGVYKYVSGENAPWYHVKAYFDTATGKIRAELDNGKEVRVLHGSVNQSNVTVFGAEYLIQKNSASSAPVSSYFDNLSLSSYVNEDVDFFVPDYRFDFDDVTTLVANEGFYTDAYKGWFVQNIKDNGVVVASATGAEIDGRKALKAQTNGKTHFEVMNYFPSYNVTRYSFDMRVDTSSKFVIAIRGYNTENQVAYGSISEIVWIVGNKVKLTGDNELGEIALGKWYRYVLEFDMTAGTYTTKLIDLTNNTSVTSDALAIPDNIIKLTALEYYSPASAVVAYLDNVCYGAAKSYVIEEATTAGEVVDAAAGAEFVTGYMIDPSATTYTLNGVEGGAWIDANGMGSVGFGYLEPNTEYTLAYNIVNVYGETISGELTFTTDSLGYGLEGLGLSKDTAEAGEISANVTGRLKKGEEAQLMVAVYEKGDALKLVGVEIVPITSVKEAKTYSADITVPDDTKEYEVKAFLWDGIAPLLISEGI